MDKSGGMFDPSDDVNNAGADRLPAIFGVPVEKDEGNTSAGMPALGPPMAAGSRPESKN